MTSGATSRTSDGLYVNGSWNNLWIVHPVLRVHIQYIKVAIKQF